MAIQCQLRGKYLKDLVFYKHFCNLLNIYLGHPLVQNLQDIVYPKR